MLIAVHAQRRRVRGERSEVAATMTERFIPSGPSVFSMNSLSSRPRSPIKANTTKSAFISRPRWPSRLDFPTPEPANKPSLCPRTIGRSVLKTAVPVSIRSPRVRRCVGGGGAAVGGHALGPRNKGSPSMGCPNGSITRPSQDQSGAISTGSVSCTGWPRATPTGASSGSIVMWSGASCRTSPMSGAGPPREMRNLSPNRALSDNPEICTRPPSTRITRPTR